jgi:ATP-binding cassette subfamily F protein 3
VGLVGPNGSGKSSLFALVRDELHADAGDVSLPPRWVISHVAQETPALPAPALEFVIDGDVELREIEAAITAAESDPKAGKPGSDPGFSGDGEELAHLHARYGEIGGYQARARAQTMLAGLGFDEAAQARAVAEFSGGWRMRLNLARALMRRADLLLLDEPTNHLDLDAVLWLEDWLKAFRRRGGLHHPRPRVPRRRREEIVHVENRKLNEYTGNYTAFEAQRAERLSLQQSAYEKQQKTIAHLEAFITRFRAKATKARQAQSRIRALEKLERIAAAHVDSPFTFAFRSPEESRGSSSRSRTPRSATAASPWSTASSGACCRATPSDCSAPNGRRQVTLLKSIVGNLPLLGGKLHTAQALRIGYFAQHQVDQLRVEETPLWHLEKLSPGEREQVFRNFLGGFDIRADQVNQRVSTFSGGEKARLALALIVWQRPNLLLLDEPTNHLDIDMREALAQALVDFEGALIVVAHDRHLLQAATDQWMLVADGKLAPFEGDLDDYKKWSREYHALGRKRDTREEAPANRKEERRLEAAARQRDAQLKKPFEKKLAAIERELETLGAESAEVEAWLATAEAYEEANRERMQAALKRRGELKEKLGKLEDDWLWTQAEMDRAAAGPAA